MAHLQKIFLFFLLFTLILFSQESFRKEIHVPDILGYKTLKCDFHMHTVFSDGSVWPDIRVEEAWREGLDCIAITDHIEYQPHKDDIRRNNNRSYELALSVAEKFGIMLIRGTEITKSMPPGHFNAIFIKDANLLDTADFRVAFRLAREQGSFTVFNHPFWRDPDYPVVDGKVRWMKEHQELFDAGLFQGIEIVNETSYYPEAFRWALENNLTILGNSDVHIPVTMFWDYPAGEHRPVNLLFVTEKSPEGVKDALLSRRTVVYYEDMLFGKEEYLNAIFSKSVTVKKIGINGKNTFFEVSNNSSFDYKLSLKEKHPDFNIPDAFTLKKNSKVHITIRNKENKGTFPLETIFTVKNLHSAPEKPIDIKLVFE
ncbi:MAG TPA: Sb-PDE family phosphodiesterase [Ignavibacteriaceae bacterium]|nr:Sb-PDE family phosphodiesterase [Ignavibacteriaceae bacterium]